MPPTERDEELREIRQHLDALVAGNIALGHTEDEAVSLTIHQFGRAEQVGRSLNEIWAGGSAKQTRSSLRLSVLIYFCSAVFIFGFFVLANDKPTDFPYSWADQILLAMIMPIGILAKSLFDYLRMQSVSE